MKMASMGDITEMCNLDHMFQVWSFIWLFERHTITSHFGSHLYKPRRFSTLHLNSTQNWNELN